MMNGMVLFNKKWACIKKNYLNTKDVMISKNITSLL